MSDTHRAGPNWPFWLTLSVVTGAYLTFLLGLLLARATYTSPHHLIRAVGSPFAIRQMRSTFDHLPTRPEDVAMTLGCSRGKAVWLVTLPAARRGMFSAASVAWARSLGEFGPILVFAGATRMKTEVLPTTVWLELSVGNLEAAIAVSLMMVALAVAVLLAMRSVGERP